jgi:hypothetical protein
MVTSCVIGAGAGRDGAEDKGIAMMMNFRK